MRMYYKYMRKYGVVFIIGILCLTAEALCDLLQPTIMAKIVDIGVKEKNGEYVIQQGLKMLGIASMGAVFACIRATLASHVSHRIGCELRFDLFKKIQEFAFINKDTFGDASLITRLTNDVTQVQNFINGLMRIFVKAPILCIGSIIMAVSLSPKMSLVLLIIVPIIVWLIVINLSMGYPYFVKIQKALDQINTVMREYLAGVRVVKAFNRFDYEVERFEKKNVYLSNINMRAAKRMAIFAPVIQLTINIGIVIILWLGGTAVQSGSIKVGEIIAFINYMTQILFSLSMITHVFMSFVRAKASSERIQQVFKEENEKSFYKLTDEGNEAFQSTAQKGSVVFDKVWFSYHHTLESPVLKYIDFKCNKGEIVGVIGATGAGKSTLINLIPGFYYPTSGAVKVNGVDIKTINPKYLREKIAVVPQKTILFTGTIEENIRWGKAKATMEEIKEAASIAQAHEFIAGFPEGYETQLGQGGVNLSGGQKQRIAIARALIKKPEILILDDCTSAVDLKTEAKIRSGLRQYMQEVTSFIITQRISSIMDADKIIVLNHGEIVGNGKHEVLLNNCKVYREILSSQRDKEAM
ncbi:ABC transporter ATP-binding protein [Cellulosilyticum sp. I15G10I2]|uniref:ABC transporter ATP-binding protein n=1 Tax=Cellulosilyticum sp. I15G10I2 TaxID=1892843 RepID=UPI00085BDCED|nr:ABC transporter ATP-binding protein [Cellulosilyticum sp. I15G10I2]